MIWSILKADAIWTLATIVLYVVAAVVGIWWKRRRKTKPPGPFPDDPYCRHCARCEKCCNPGNKSTRCLRGPDYCETCRAGLHPPTGLP